MLKNTVRFHHEHDHEHVHEHGHDHDHEHSHACEGDCSRCDPMKETVALMDYMVRHNAAHTQELEQLAKKVAELGNTEAAEQILAAVSDYEKGNVRLSAVLAAMK